MSAWAKQNQEAAAGRDPGCFFAPAAGRGTRAGRKKRRCCTPPCNKRGGAGRGGQENGEAGERRVTETETDEKKAAPRPDGRRDGEKKTAKDRGVRRADVIQKLWRVATAPANGAIRIAAAETKEAKGLDLMAVAEFKSDADGTVAVKLIDRVKALEALYAMLGEEADEDQEGLMRALGLGGKDVSWQE